MSTNKKRIPGYTDQIEQLSSEQAYHLLRGHNLIEDEKKLFKNESERKKAYFKHKEYLFSLLGTQRDSFRPFLPWGERPAGWWDYEWPSLGLRTRLQIDGPRMIPISDKMSFGKHRLYETCQPGVQWESQFSYLKAHDLLLPNEAQGYFEQEAKKMRLRERDSEADAQIIDIDEFKK